MDFTGNEGQIVRVMTLNIRFGLAKDGNNCWERRKSVFPELLKQYRADFLALQEVNDFQADFISHILPRHQIIGIRTPAPAFWQNNVIFFDDKWKCRFRDHFFLSPTPDIPSRLPKSNWPRQCTMGLFEKEGRRLICINTHLDFSPEVQAHSAHLIMKRLSGLPEDIPAILMGDFNAEPHYSCFKIFTGEKKALHVKTGYFNSVFKKPYPGTFHGFTGETDGDHIDWILFRGRLETMQSEVISDSFSGIYPSDHFPVYAVFCQK